MDETESNERGESGEIKFAEVLDLSPEQEAHFKELINKNGGLIRVLVHPFYSHEDECISGETDQFFILFGGSSSTKGYGSKEQKYFEAVRRLVEDCHEKNIPLIVFEQADKINSLNGLFKNTGTDNVIIVRTRRDSPYPFFDNDPEGINCDQHKERKYQNDLEGVVVVLKELGAEKAIVGGRRLTLDPDDRTRPAPYYFIYHRPFDNVKGTPFSGKKIYTSGCVGYIGQALQKNGIETQFSTISGITYSSYYFRKKDEK